MVWVGRDILDHLIPLPLPQAGTPSTRPGMPTQSHPSEEKRLGQPTQDCTEVPSPSCSIRYLYFWPLFWFLFRVTHKPPSVAPSGAMACNRGGTAKSMAVGGMRKQGNACKRAAQPTHKICLWWVPRYRANYHKRRSKDQHLHHRDPHTTGGARMATLFLGQPQPCICCAWDAQPAQHSSPPSIGCPPEVHLLPCYAGFIPELANSAVGASMVWGKTSLCMQPDR